jgi:hypothetical protein
MKKNSIYYREFSSFVHLFDMDVKIAFIDELICWLIEKNMKKEIGLVLKNFKKRVEESDNDINDFLTKFFED